MDAELYLEMAAIEEKHWWFVARRKILDKIIKSLKLPQDAEILDAGCGTGGNLAMLARYGQVYAMELDPVARDFAAKRGIGEIKPGCFPDDIPFKDKSFDLIVLLDVLEHLDDDLGSLKELRSRLKPGGRLLITVPAYRFLWSKHDRVHHHKRRYVIKGLRRVVMSAGYTVNYVSYFNFWLFPLIAGIRILKRWLGSEEDSDTTMPSATVNKILTALFASERYLLGKISLPFGVSLILLAQN